MNTTLTRRNLELICGALSEEIRLVDSYINKSDSQRAHLKELRDLWFEVDELARNTPAV